MALVSPCPLGDVHHPTYPKLTPEITKSVKCDNPDSCCAPRCEGMFLITFFPSSSPQLPSTQGSCPAQKYSREWGTFAKDTKWGKKTFSCWSWIILWQSISGWPSEYSSPLRATVSYCFTQISNSHLMQCFTNKINRDECRSQASDISNEFSESLPNSEVTNQILVQGGRGDWEKHGSQNVVLFFIKSKSILAPDWREKPLRLKSPENSDFKQTKGFIVNLNSIWQ